MENKKINLEFFIFVFKIKIMKSFNKLGIRLPSKHYLKYKICVSGAAETTHCKEGIFQKVKELGKEIVKHNGILITGATTGVPYWAAIGAKEAGGISIGISPASSELEHIKKYKLPIDYFDLIIYTGFEYSGRNLLLTRASDAIIVACGRIGTLNEFTIAFEDKKPIGVLTSTGGIADMVEEITKRAPKEGGKIVFDSNPHNLVVKLLEVVDKEKVVKIKRKSS